MRETIRNGALTAAAIATMGGLFAPWLRSGERGRSSFELFDLVARLGFAPDGAFAWVLRLWPLTPLAIVAAVVAVWFGRARLAGVVGVFAGCVVTGVALGITQAPEAGLVDTDWGVSVSLVGGLLLIAASLWVAVVGRPDLAVSPDVAVEVYLSE